MCQNATVQSSWTSAEALKRKLETPGKKTGLERDSNKIEWHATSQKDARHGIIK